MDELSAWSVWQQLSRLALSATSIASYAQQVRSLFSMVIVSFRENEMLCIKLRKRFDISKERY